MQRLRGRLYLNDGAITQNDLSPDGRHILPEDDKSWHLLALNDSGDVLGCTRFLQHTRKARFDSLKLSGSALASSEFWGGRLRAAIEEDLALSRAADVSYVEVGGWAMAEQVRCTAECLRSVLAIFAWSRLIGGAIGVSTATERNGSASILRRLGGSSINCRGIEMPSYHDPRYGCRMHMLRYDSQRPNPRYEGAIESIREKLAYVPVIRAERHGWRSLFSGFSMPDNSVIRSEPLHATV